MKPGRLIFLEIDQEFDQPRLVVANRQPSDQRGAVGLGPSDRVEQLSRAGCADR